MDQAELLQYYQNHTGIGFGMTRTDALVKFSEWKGENKTCIRCQENEYKYEEFCEVTPICKEVRLNGEQNDQSANIRDTHGRSIRNVSINPVRIEAKRSALDKFRR